MSPTRQFRSCFDTVYDVCVLGAGYSGFAASLAMSAGGLRVLLVDPRGDMLWESGRAFAPDAGSSDSAAWKAFSDALAARGAACGSRIEGAVAEILATDMVMRAGVEMLYYAWPVAASVDDDLLCSLTVATKDGMRIVRAARWLDASERGDLAWLCGAAVQAKTPERFVAGMFLQRCEWAATEGITVSNGVFTPTLRSTERAIFVETDSRPESVRAQLLDALGELQAILPEARAEACVSHWSRQALPVYRAGAVTLDTPANVLCACPALAPAAVQTPADRFDLGEVAAARADRVPVAEASGVAGAPPSSGDRRVRSAVCVAGLGTGGALAAIAAGRMFASEAGHVLAVEPMFEPGGTGTAGHVHNYYFGEPGGLQAEVDERVASLRDRFGDAFDPGNRFHPFAKEVVLDHMIHEAGVTVSYGTVLAGAERQGECVKSALAVGPEGPMTIEAEQWVDATGDGDLCAFAGADFYAGRMSDGRMHACSQHVGFVDVRDERARFYSTNHDIGWVEPWDAEDLTRARVQGLRNYCRDDYEEGARPVFIAPFIGVRQGRQIVTDRMVTLDDMVARRRFDDCIGFLACWLDNHAVDAEFESDEYVFWSWHALNPLVPVACDLPYGALIPRGLDNVLIASRCLGVEQDPEYSVRMQRDMQRAGEATGYASALAATHGTGTRSIPFEVLASALHDTGALDRRSTTFESAFGVVVDAAELLPPAPEQQRVDDALAMLDRGEPGPHLWHLLKLPERCRDEVLARAGSSDPVVAWLATGVAAMWGEAVAEERLLVAVSNAEEGPMDEMSKRAPHPRMRAGWMAEGRIVPWWLDAIVLLRRCGTARALPVLAGFAERANHLFDTRAAMALTLERIVQREPGIATDSVVRMLDRLLQGDMPGAVSMPGRPVGRMARQWLAGEDVAVPTSGFAHSLQKPEDHTWQLHLVVARIRLAMGLDVQEGAREFLGDERAYVRRAFRELFGKP